jgi:hypothetical protein
MFVKSACFYFKAAVWVALAVASVERSAVVCAAKQLSNAPMKPVLTLQEG